MIYKLSHFLIKDFVCLFEGRGRERESQINMLGRDPEMMTREEIKNRHLNDRATQAPPKPRFFFLKHQLKSVCFFKIKALRFWF